MATFTNTPLVRVYIFYFKSGFSLYPVLLNLQQTHPALRHAVTLSVKRIPTPQFNHRQKPTFHSDTWDTEGPLVCTYLRFWGVNRWLVNIQWTVSTLVQCLKICSFSVFCNSSEQPLKCHSVQVGVVTHFRATCLSKLSLYNKATVPFLKNRLQWIATEYLYRVIRNDCRGFNNCHLVLQMQSHAISFYGVRSRIRLMFLLFLQVYRNWRYESEPPLKPSPLACYR